MVLVVSRREGLTDVLFEGYTQLRVLPVTEDEQMKFLSARLPSSHSSYADDDDKRELLARYFLPNRKEREDIGAIRSLDWPRTSPSADKEEALDDELQAWKLSAARLRPKDRVEIMKD